jgi:large subunit ribosomal protein L10
LRLGRIAPTNELTEEGKALMALTRIKKNEVTGEVADLLATSKMTVVAAYQGTPVKALQALRKQGRENGTKLKVVKNRLVIKAIESTDALKGTDTSALKGMLLYAFNSNDEVAPAQTLASFAKTQPTLEFVGAISSDGKFLSAEDVKALATLPSKNELIAQVVATLLSPVHDVTSALSGNLHALLDGVEAKAAN